MASEVSARDFLATLWGKDTSGIAELTVIKAKGSIQSWPWTYPASVGNLVGAAERHNSALRQGDSGVYVGVCLRREQWPRQNKAGEIEKRGTEENALLTNVIWADVDFVGLGHKGKVVEPDQAKKLMHECPCRPSLVVHTGGGVQIYWMLKEPAMGDDLWRVKAINVALKTYFGGDPTGDLARIFRLPGSTNPKYPAMPKAKVTYWHPEHAYLLDDFDVFSPDVEAVKPGSAVVLPSAPGTPGTPAGSHHPRLAPGSVVLSESSVDLIKNHLADIWLEGWRHRMALYIGGLFAHAGVSLEQAADIVACVSSFRKGDTKGRVKDVEDTYRRFASEKKIAGATAIEKMIREEFPAPLNANAKKIFDIVRKAIPRPPKNGDGDGDGQRKGAEPDFDAVKVIKYTSTPARYVVTIKLHKDGSVVEVPCGNSEICQKINKFRTAFFEATPKRSIAMVKQRTWEMMLEAAEYEEREAPPEATMSGAIGFELETFMDERKEKPEIGELRSYPGYDEEKLYFSFNTFKGRLRDNGLRPNDQELTDVLKNLGWDSRRIRMGAHTRRLWWKAVTGDEDENGNGNGNGNGHGPTPKPEPQSSLPFEEPIPAPPVQEPTPEETSGSEIDPENPF